MFKFFKIFMGNAYSAPRTPEPDEPIDKTPMACVYAGPDQMNSKRNIKEAEMIEVYAGPEMLDDRLADDYKKVSPEELPTYPAQFKSSSKENEKPIKFVYAGPDFFKKNDTTRFAGVYAGPSMQMNTGMAADPINNNIDVNAQEGILCPDCNTLVNGKFCPGCGRLMEKKND